MNRFHDETTSGPRLNLKTVLSTYGEFHVKDKTATDVLSLTWELPYLVRPSFLLRRPPGWQMQPGFEPEMSPVMNRISY